MMFQDAVARLKWATETFHKCVYSELRVILNQWSIKYNSDFAEKNALVLVNLTKKFVRRIENSDYAEFIVQQCNFGN